MMMNNTSNNPPWEDLPQELLSTIADFLIPNPIDILAFRAICKSWNSSSPPFSPFQLSPKFPLVSATPHYIFDMRFALPVYGRHPLVTVTAIFALPLQQPSTTVERDAKCWLMFVTQLTPGKLMIRKPFTKSHYRTPLNFPTILDVHNIRVHEIARFYNFSFHPEVNQPPRTWSEHVQKVVVNSDESKVFALFHTGKVGILISPNRPRAMWGPVSPFGFGNDGRINDIVYHKGKLLGVDHVGRLYVLKLSNYTEKIIPSPITGTCTKRKRLVESNGLVYLVARINEEEGNGRGLKFMVYELDENLDELVEVSSIGNNTVFFFGLDFSFSVSPQKLGISLFAKNSIIYIEHSFRDYEEGVEDDVELFSHLRFGDLRVGVWRMDHPYYHLTIGSYPGYSNVLWPPPPWLWSIDTFKRIEDLKAATSDLLVEKDDNNQLDCSGTWGPEEKVRVCMNEAILVHKHVVSISKGYVFVTPETELSGIILEVEEATTKLQKALNYHRRQQSFIDAVGQTVLSERA